MAVTEVYNTDNKKVGEVEEEFIRVCIRKKLKVNVTKNKVMQYVRDGIIMEMNIVMDSQILEEVEVSKYLESLESAESFVG